MKSSQKSVIFDSIVPGGSIQMPGGVVRQRTANSGPQLMTASCRLRAGGLRNRLDCVDQREDLMNQVRSATALFILALAPGVALAQVAASASPRLQERTPAYVPASAQQALAAQVETTATVSGEKSQGGAPAATVTASPVV